MFKHVFTVMRGRAARAEDEFNDAHALLILEQQLREGTAAVAAARKAVALAIAQQQIETRSLERTRARIADLETRALAAVQGGRDALAREAAESLAILEEERDASRESLETFEDEIARLRSGLRACEHRVRELRRGQRVANAADRTARVRALVADGGGDALADAEATLKRLRSTQRESELAAAALDELDPERLTARMSAKLAEAGCGPALRSSADAVLERLRERAGVADVIEPA